MAQSKVTVRLPRRATLFTSLISLLAIFLGTVEIKAQTRKRTSSRSSRAEGKTARQSNKPTCDDLAAHPEDKGRTGLGVADELIVPEPAIEQCARAVRQSPNVARFHFQLGRAYWAGKRYDEALAAFLNAEELEYSPAYFYLAKAYEQGLIQGEQADLATARNLYMLAAAEGFEPAVRSYGEFEEVYEINFEDFAVPSYAQVIYRGDDLNRLNSRRMLVIFYMEGIQRFLDRTTDIIDPTCAKISDPTASAAIDEIIKVELMEPDDPIWVMARAISAGDYAEARTEGAYDMHRMVAEYGGCLGTPVTRFYNNVKQFLREHPAKRDRYNK